MKIKVYNIEWDTDGEVNADLPKEVIIDNPADEIDDIADYLSDEYGFCIFGFCTELID